jgi:aminoglycoside phosphotransferase (APT) family kinase protein
VYDASIPEHPQTQHVIDVCKHFSKSSVLRMSRFPTGLCHHVYDVVFVNGDRVVVRMATDETRQYLRGGIFWSGILRPMGIPLPKLIHADAESEPFPYMILERLEGTDLCHVYVDLTANEKRKLAHKLAQIQMTMATLPRGAGYGYVSDIDGPFPFNTWQEVLQHQLLRSRQWTETAGVIDIEHIRPVERRLAKHEDYFSSIASIAFLDDITTKNVLLSNGILSGIVDVDEVCFGDRLFSLALTRMALLAHQLETDYIDYWISELALDRDQIEILDFYTAMHCCAFIGENGQRFNRSDPEPVDHGYLRRLLEILNRLLL